MVASSTDQSRSYLPAFLPSFVSGSMTLLFDEAKVPVPDGPRKPPQRIIQLERCDRISSPAANAIKNSILELDGAKIERENLCLTFVEC
jgi:hypothetical protein